MLALLLLVACGGDDDAPGAETTTSTGPTESTTSPTAAATTTTLDDEGLGDVEAVLQDLLLTPVGIGDASFADVGYAPGVELPCGAVATDGDALAGTTLRSDDLGLTVTEELRAYADPELASLALQAVASALTCSPGAADATERMGAPALHVPLSDRPGGVVVAQVADVLVVVIVDGPSHDQLTPENIAATAVGSVLAYVEAPG